jgi:O-antigen/teichoic acid export membrane protein
VPTEAALGAGCERSPAAATIARVTPSPHFARDTVVLTTGLALAQAISWAVMPLWSRLYTPADFAALGLWGSVVSVVSMLLLLRYDSCIVIATNDEQARALVRLILALALGGGTLLAALAALLPPAVLQAWGLAPLGRWLPAAVLVGALAAVFAAGLGWANRRRDYFRISVARVAVAATAALLGLVAGALGLGGGRLEQISSSNAVGTAAAVGATGGAAALAGAGWAGAGTAAMASGAAGPAAGAFSSGSAGLLWAHLLAAVLGVLLLRWSWGPASSVRTAAHAHAQAPRYLWPSAMLDALTQQIPLWLTLHWFGEDWAGQFSLAWRVVALPVFMLAGAAGSVFYQGFAAAAALQAQPADGTALRAMLWQMWRRFALLGVVPAVLLAAFGPALFTWAFGAPWAQAGLLAAILAPMLWMMLISSPTSGALIVLGLQRAAPWFGAAMLIYRPTAFAIGAWAGSLPLALALWVVMEVLAIVIYNALLLRRLRQLPALPAAPTV